MKKLLSENSKIASLLFTLISIGSIWLLFRPSVMEEYIIFTLFVILIIIGFIGPIFLKRSQGEYFFLKTICIFMVIFSLFCSFSIFLSLAIFHSKKFSVKEIEVNKDTALIYLGIGIVYFLLLKYFVKRYRMSTNYNKSKSIEEEK